MAFHSRSIVTTALIVASLAIPGTAIAQSGVDQYSSHLPTPGGSNNASGIPPSANPSMLPSRTWHELQGLSPTQRDQLATLATSKDLGAPTSTSGGTASGPGSQGVPTSALDAVASGPGLALLAILLAIAALGATFRFRRREHALRPVPDSR